MVMASMMLYLDRVTEVDEEVAEYSQLRFHFFMFQLFVQLKNWTKESAVQRYRWSSGIDVGNVVCYTRWYN